MAASTFAPALLLYELSNDACNMMGGERAGQRQSCWLKPHEPLTWSPSLCKTDSATLRMLHLHIVGALHLSQGPPYNLDVVMKASSPSASAQSDVSARPQNRLNSDFMTACMNEVCAPGKVSRQWPAFQGGLQQAGQARAGPAEGYLCKA